MGILIGMDEAGYGPHLGPLVIAASAWHVSEDGSDDVRASDGEAASVAVKNAARKKRSSRNARASASTAVLNQRSAGTARRVVRNPKSRVDLYRLLRNVVAKTTSERRVPIADSKVLYSSGTGLRHLERGLHTILLTMQRNLGNWSEMVRYCEADPDGLHTHACWPDGHNSKLPVDATNDELQRLSARFIRACDSTGVRPLLIRARLVFPAQFNDLIEHHGNKATALSHITIGLLREVMDSIPAHAHPALQLAPIFTVCDKHGGRNFYTAILQHHFSEHWVSPVFESHAESHYEWGAPEARTRVVFQVNGERFLPTALASMTAKYLRELSMKAFNEYWRAHVPDIKPTAGYYRDAWRFKKDIATKQQELGIDDHVVWRNR
jgi:ribonuclease HII